ncbi:MAG: F0F1 ATP synthase subunit alpha [Planctomycetaceae bacterium]|nr:F0F1 ATP synthase subunit alpha [Planctomycetaceae bacterium]
MKFDISEIAGMIRQEIAASRDALDVSRIGRVVEVGDGIARIVGLPDAMAGEMLEFENGRMGQVFNLEDRIVGGVVYGSSEDIRSGMSVRTTGRLLQLPAGPEMLGRVISPLGEPIDGKGPIKTSQTRPLEVIAPGIAERQSVTEPLSTGIKAVDAMIPIGRGQRELIIGDRKTGKTAIAVDTIINQKDTGVICVYVAVGQKESTVAGVVEVLRRAGAMEHTVVVIASSSEAAPLQYIAPYAGCAIAEYFMYAHGAATLVVYDDLSKQAAAYRQISLLLRRPPGREAYPGDVFYLHSRLLERACKLAEHYVIVPKDADEQALAEAGKAAPDQYVGVLGMTKAKEDLAAAGHNETHDIRMIPGTGGSMTALPICETQEGEVSAYIPTNLISITDGQIYLEPALFFSGIRPAINVGISVSRVGFKAAWPAMKRVAASLRLDLAAYRELATFAQLGMDLDAASQSSLDRGQRLIRLLTQPQYQPMPPTDQVISIFAGTRGHLDSLTPEEVPDFERGLLQYIPAQDSDLYEQIRCEHTLDKTAEKRLARLIEEYKQTQYRSAGPDGGKEA